MKNILKKIFYTLPKPVRQIIISGLEFFTYLTTKNRLGNFQIKNTSTGKKNILIYHINGLSFGGTEKNLQMIAKYLSRDKYNVFFIHSTDTEKNRMSYFGNMDIKIIKFSHNSIRRSWPYFIKDMSPTLEEVIIENNIDCLITATPGQTIYPIINIKNIPIILINIFGSFSMQKNIKTHICISEEVKKLASRVIPNNKLRVQYIPSEKPILNQGKAMEIRNRFGIKDTDLVFGRIGRADNSIFDPIGLLAFKIVVKSNPDTHYIIMSPANKARQLVNERKIPNVHWLESSCQEEDIWAFHQAIDILAHFRNDGESCGLNIIESMLVGNPILSHKSHIWNAHLEYLDTSFSLVSEKDDYEEYAKNMLEFIDKNKTGELKMMGKKAKEKAENMFLIQNVIQKYEKWIDDSIFEK